MRRRSRATRRTPNRRARPRPLPRRRRDRLRRSDIIGPEGCSGSENARRPTVPSRAQNPRRDFRSSTPCWPRCGAIRELLRIEDCGLRIADCGPDRGLQSFQSARTPHFALRTPHVALRTSHFNTHSVYLPPLQTSSHHRVLQLQPPMHAVRGRVQQARGPSQSSGRNGDRWHVRRRGDQLVPPRASISNARVGRCEDVAGAGSTPRLIG